MNDQNITSGEQYGLLLSYELSKSTDDLPENLVDLWCEIVYHAAINSYNEYILGHKEYYQLTIEEMEEYYKMACEKYTEIVLSGMVDKELLKLSVDENGEFVYSLTEKGIKEKNRLLGDQ